MLVPEVDLQVVNRFAVAHEPKVSRFDHARVNWTHTDLVDLLAAELIERVVVHPAEILSLEPDRFQPRVIRERQSELLVNLPLKAVHLRVLSRERGEDIARVPLPDEQFHTGLTEDDRVKGGGPLGVAG